MQNAYPGEVYINGEWWPREQAVVSVFDRGFLFGDGIYEVIPAYDNKLFTLAEHLRRMQNGLEAIGIAFDAAALADVARQAVARASFPNGEGCVYLQVTRGVAPRAHRFPPSAAPTVVAYGFPFSFQGFQDKLATAVLSPDERWHKCHIKSISLVANVLANQEAHSQGAGETVLVRDGLLTEGSHTNVFFVKNGTVFTHPLGSHVLPGITRQLVLKFCGEEGIPVREEAIRLSELPSMDEAFLTGTTTQVVAIGKIVDGGKQPFLAHGPGPVTKRVQDAYARHVRQFVNQANGG